MENNKVDLTDKVNIPSAFGKFNSSEEDSFDITSLSDEDLDSMLSQNSEAPVQEVKGSIRNMSSEEIDNALRSTGEERFQDFTWDQMGKVALVEILYSGIEGAVDILAGAGNVIGKGVGAVTGGLIPEERLKAPFSGEDLIGQFSPANLLKDNVAQTGQQRGMLEKARRIGEIGKVIPQVLSPLDKTVGRGRGAKTIVDSATQGIIAGLQIEGEQGQGGVEAGFSEAALVAGANTGLALAGFGLGAAGNKVKNWLSRFITADEALAEEAAVKIMTQISQTATDRQAIATYERERNIWRRLLKPWQKYEDVRVTENIVLKPDALKEISNKVQSKMRVSDKMDKDNVKSLVSNLYEDAYRVDISNIETNQFYQQLQSEELVEVKTIIDSAIDVLGKGKGKTVNSTGEVAPIIFKYDVDKGIESVRNWDSVKRYLQQNLDNNVIISTQKDEAGNFIKHTLTDSDLAEQKKAINLVKAMMDEATGGKYRNARLVAQRQIVGSDGVSVTLEHALAKGDLEPIVKSLANKRVSSEDLDILKLNLDTNDYLTLIRSSMDRRLKEVRSSSNAKPSDIYDQFFGSKGDRDFYMEALNVPGMENARLKLMFVSKLMNKVEITQGAEQAGALGERAIQKFMASGEKSDNDFNRKIIKFIVDPVIGKQLGELLNTPEGRNMLINNAQPPKEFVQKALNLINNQQLKLWNKGVQLTAIPLSQVPAISSTERDKAIKNFKEGARPWD